MNKRVWRGKLKQLRGSLVQAWGRLTDDRMLVIEGEQDAVEGHILERIGRLRAMPRQPIGAAILPFRK